MFLSIVLVSDEYLKVKETFQNDRRAQFLNIAQKLPQELQMVLSLRCSSLKMDLIKSKYLTNVLRTGNFKL